MANGGRILFAAPERFAAGLILFRIAEVGLREYLMLKTSYGEHHWTPPKGHVDPGETAEQAAVRETWEESGLTSNDYKIFPKFERKLQYFANGKHKQVTYFLAQLTNLSAIVHLSDEHEDFKWLNVEEAGKIAKYEAMAICLTDAEKYLQSLPLNCLD